MPGEVARLVDSTCNFPCTDDALDDPNGLLAIGGDLSAERLLAAYHHGIFPWFNEGEPIQWWSPDPRTILQQDSYHVSTSFRRFLRRTSWRATLNMDFSQVVQACASVPRDHAGTWLTPEMQSAYARLHQLGHAHSVEIWDACELVGGIYGIAVGSAFCGESMFHRRTNASKLALFHLSELVYSLPLGFIDCQLSNSHLRSLGAKDITRPEFLASLSQSAKVEAPNDFWSPKPLQLNR